MAQAKVIAYMQKNFAGPLKFSPDIKIVLVPENRKDGPAPSGNIEYEHRMFFAKLVRAMTEARAKVVAFDITFAVDSEWDKDFGAAIADAERNGVKIVSGIDDPDQNGSRDPESPVDLPLTRLGSIRAGGSQTEGGPVGTILMAYEPAGDKENDLAALPSLPLLVVMEQHDPPLFAEFDDWHQNVQLYSQAPERDLKLSIPLERSEGLLLDQATRESLSTARVYADKLNDKITAGASLRRDYENKIVLVGYEYNDTKEILSGETRLGIELHATAISNILNGVFIKTLSPSRNYLIILLMALLGAFLHTSVGRSLEFRVPIPIPFTALQLPVPLGVIVVAAAYLIVGFAVYRLGRVYLDVCYHIAALLISYGGLWLVLNKWFTEPKKEALWTVD